MTVVINELLSEKLTKARFKAFVTYFNEKSKAGVEIDLTFKSECLL
jgi:hypothetical protein